MAGLRSRVILITGATSCIGRSTALSFAEIGAKLALVGMKTKDTDSKEASYESQRLEKISEECKHLGAADIHIGQYDVTNRDGCRIALEEATESFRDNLNVLINIPPVPRPETGALTSTNNDQAFEKLFTANIMAAFRFSQLSVPYLARASMKSATSGTIINVNGPDKTSDASAYLAQRLSQKATQELTTRLAVSLAPQAIRVNAILAGGNLSLNDNGSCSSNALLRHVNSSFSGPEKRADGSNPPEKEHQGLKKTGSTHDIAALIRFLASDEASFITGQTIFADGGASLGQNTFN